MGHFHVTKDRSIVVKSQYHNATQYRLDLWNKLKSATRRLALSVNQQQSLDFGADHTSLREDVRDYLKDLSSLEFYWAFPGKSLFKSLIEHESRGDFDQLSLKSCRIASALLSGEYRRKYIDFEKLDIIDAEAEWESAIEGGAQATFERARKRPYFEVLIVDNLTEAQVYAQEVTIASMRRDSDPFTYSPVFVSSAVDALNAITFNHNIQAVIIRSGFTMQMNSVSPITNKYLDHIALNALVKDSEGYHSIFLANAISQLRPELDLYMVSDQAVEDIAGKVGDTCKRVFYNSEDFLELHLNVLRGVDERYQTPFFTALKKYSSRPTGVFHALPISRGKSILKSHWIQDMGEFYGINIFLAETSTTTGGLDSLLAPVGAIKESQDLAAKAFGAKQTFFATNGTSTCNKIVLQALVRPDDIVLIDRDCHKSHHYGLVLSGAQVVYLDSYPLHEYSMYGGVPIRSMKERLLQLREEGSLDRVKMMLLTNCTFDGLVYNVERVMEECLAIKPDLIFLWDEAWFAFAGFSPTYRHRTGMQAANRLREKYRTADYKEDYADYQQRVAKLDDNDIDSWLDERMMPDPDKVRIRVYATQSTHKTLTALRQGSMIHVNDQDYCEKVEESFHEAYMTHTSTSPNYQILASLDVGRRQVQLEGFELVQKQVEMAMTLRSCIMNNPLLTKYFRVLNVGEMIPGEFRQSGLESYLDPEFGWNEAWSAWKDDEFCLDPTRVTLCIGKTGMDGETFKNKVLMDKYGIQINKTAKNSVLFMTNIGTTRSSIAYLIEVLVKCAKELDVSLASMSPAEIKNHHKNVNSVMKELPDLPDFSSFHQAFRPNPESKVGAGNLRDPYFLAYDGGNSEYFSIDGEEIDEAMSSGREIVSSGFIIPYPPGFPILVPGQIASPEIIDFLRKTDVKEIHGYRPDIGLKVFTEEALQQALPENKA